LQDNSQLTLWTKCDATWSEIQQQSTCKTTWSDSQQSGQNVMQHGQKFNNTLQDNSQLTGWTKCDATWSEIQQHLARQQSTHQLDKM
jgi:hypothetical protein